MSHLLDPGFVDAVGQALDELPAGGDFYAPLLLTIEPDGSVSADFSGHIRAAGVDLLRSEGGVDAAEDRKVRWLRETDDDPRAYVGAKNPVANPSGGGTDLEAYAYGADAIGGHGAHVELRATRGQFNSGTGRTGRVALHLQDSKDLEGIVPTRRIYVEAEKDDVTGLTAATIWNSGLQSDFVQLNQVNGVPGPMIARLHVAHATFNLPSIGANANLTMNVPFPAGTCKVGDRVIDIHPTALAGGLVRTGAIVDPVTVADQISLTIRNVTAAAIDDVARLFVAYVLQLS